MFAGVGPFAVPAAKQGVHVFANDLNPAAVRFLEANGERNRVPGDMLETFNLDASEFIQELSRRQGLQWRPDHVVMNLPDTAIEFLPALRPWRRRGEGQTMRVHCYCFSASEDPHDDAVRRVTEALELDLQDLHDLTVHDVRKVSPRKVMLCVEFLI